MTKYQVNKAASLGNLYRAIELNKDMERRCNELRAEIQAFKPTKVKGFMRWLCDGLTFKGWSVTR